MQSIGMNYLQTLGEREYERLRLYLLKDLERECLQRHDRDLELYDRDLDRRRL
jgi:hypothetical protein